MSGRTYDRDEVEAILKVALERADTVEGLTRAELSEVAAEVGIPVTDLDGAIELIEREREVQASMTQIVAERRRGFYWALGNATIVTSFLAVIDFVQGPGWWVPYVAAAWGMALTFRGRRAFFAPSEDIEKLARKRLAKEWRKRDWKKRERELPKAVEAGAAALIEAAARKILDAGATLITLGGDHGIPIPVFRALEGRGPIHLIHVDAHLDWRNDVNGVTEGYSSPIRRAA